MEPAEPDFRYSAQTQTLTGFFESDLSQHNAMVQVGREGLGPTELEFWLHLARLDLFGIWPECVPKGKSVV